MSIDLTRFHSSFFNESTDQLETAERCLLVLERSADDQESVNELFRAIHSIKGSAGTLGFEAIASVAHEFESVLEQVRKKDRRLDDELVGLCYAALDLISAMVVSARDELEPVDQSRVSGVVSRLVQIYQTQTVLPTVTPIIEPVMEPAVTSETLAKLNRFLIKFSPLPDFCRSGNDPLLYLRELSTKGSTTVRLDTTRLVPLDQLDPELTLLGWNIEIETAVDRAGIQSIFEWVQDICELGIQELNLPLVFDDDGASVFVAPNERAAKQLELEQAERRRPTVHVRADRLDSLINQISEIAISHGMFKQTLRQFSDQIDIDPNLGRLDRQLRELQDTVLSLRMLPVRVLFGRFERAVRDARSELGKEVHLEVEGAETELDKNLIEKLADPIMHLVKNALDHGIDLPQERLDSGKARQGLISLKAKHEGGSVVITVTDDGRGIDPAKIRSTAIAMGLARETDNFTERQWLQFIYHAGFSTAKAVNQWSGRGVGLDAVQSTIVKLGGELSLDSVVGQGSTFSIRLPLTLAIIDALMVRSGASQFAVPMTFVRECLQRKAIEFADVSNDVQLPKVHDEFLFSFDLKRYLHRLSGQLLDTNSESKFFIVIQTGAKKALVGVDEIFGQEQIVVRSLEKHFSNPIYASGATILGDGSVALILDPGALIKNSSYSEQVREVTYG